MPGAVRKLVVGGKAGATRRLVDWVAPSADGGSPVTGYQVVVRKGTKKVLATTVSGSKLTLRRAKLPAGKLTVVIIPSFGERYLSTALYAHLDV